MTHWAFDIETDTTATPVDPDIPAGLDPRAAAVTSIAACSHTESWVASAVSEEDRLIAFVAWLGWLDDGDTVCTWNGGGFDWPYLAHRASLYGLDLGATLTPHPDREPKYDPLPTAPGVMRVAHPRIRHVDVAWCYRSWATERGWSWSLKGVAGALGLDPLIAGSGAEVDRMDGATLAAYNLSDAWLTLRLARLCSAGLLDYFAD